MYVKGKLCVKNNVKRSQKREKKDEKGRSCRARQKQLEPFTGSIQSSWSEQGITVLLRISLPASMSQVKAMFMVWQHLHLVRDVAHTAWWLHWCLPTSRRITKVRKGTQSKRAFCVTLPGVNVIKSPYLLITNKR